MWFLNGLEGQIEIRNDDLGFDIWTTLGFVDYRRSNITLSSHFSSISQSRRRRKGQLISKGNFSVFNQTKNERKHFCISALASKMGQIIKIMAHYHPN